MSVPPNYHRPVLTVADFYRAGRESLQLDWELNEEHAASHRIVELALNRPGLALAGYLRHYANKRIQVLGLAETGYLSYLPPEERAARVLALGDVPGIVLSLIKRGHSLISDDAIVLTRLSTGSVLGSAVGIIREHMEIRGLGIMHVPSLFGAAAMRDSTTLDLIIRMRRAGTAPDDIDRTGLDTTTRNVLGVEIPLITLPVAPGRDVTNVVEIAALNCRLKQMGHDAARELDARIMETLSRKEKPNHP